MDQYVSVFGRNNAAVLIDCRSLASQSVELPPGAAIVAVNSMVKHELARSTYRKRVEECAEAVREIQRDLRDATPDLLRAICNPVTLKRARHIVSENARVEDFVAASRKDDLAEMGRLLVASHRSLQHDYEVSCAELDFLVDTALAIPGTFGARMIGGGFGGCTVNLLDPAAVDHFTVALRDAYRAKFGIEPAFYPVQPAEGANRLS
jgi:galactokinase